MRARIAAVVGTLLLLGAFGVPSTTAKTGDETCVSSDIWFTDDSEDAGELLTDGTLQTSGRMDLIRLQAAETGDDCASIDLTLTVGEEGSDEPESVLFKLDLQEPEGSDTDWTLEFTYGAGEGAVLKKDGSEVEGTTTSGSGSQLTLRINKTTFDVFQFDGVEATTESVNGNPIQSGTYTTDSASSDKVLIVDFGFDEDADGLPDAYEEAVYGDTETADGNSTTDTDGDGISDAQEYEDGTDPTDADDPAPVEENEEEHEDPADNATYKDDGDEPGMTGNETLSQHESYAYTFHEAGNYTFQDGENPNNTMTINVEEANGHEGNDTHDGETHVVKITEDGFDPETLTIKEGDTVVFVNEDTAAHSVQSVDDGNGLDFSTLENETQYMAIAGAGAGAVILLSAIALLARWKA